MATPKAPYIAGSATSKAAALAIEPDLNKLQRMVLNAITAAGADGLTDEEMERRLGLKHVTGSPRRCELVDRDLVVDSGKTRPTSSGSAATVWVATGTPGIDPPKKPKKPTPTEAMEAVEAIREVFTERQRRTGLGSPPAVNKLMFWVKYFVGKQR